MCLRVNTLLQGGKYRIIRYINSGGFGCTYEAEPVMLQKRVAIKEFFVKDFCNRDETTAQVTVGITSKQGLVEKLRKKFVEEAQAIFDLQHPNIIRVLDVFEENGTAYYVMDYIDGRSLNELVKREGPLKEARALRYIRQIAAALQYVHDHHRLHLDVKPSNIMIDGSDQAILIDFGTSKQYDEVDGENTSTLMGKTPGYAPIEQMSSRVVQFQPATDIYALGATFYKLLTGITPLEATQLASGEELPPLPNGTSEQVANAIRSAMQLNKANRPQDMATFLATLSPVVGGEATVMDTETQGVAKGKSNLNASDPEATVPDVKPQTSYQPENRPIKTIQPPTPPRPTPPEEDTNDEHPESKRSFPWLTVVLGFVAAVILCICVIPRNTPYSATSQEAQISQQTGTINGHGYVDLGLRVKWATCNVGATDPSDYGDYFAWGEIKPKSEYTTDNSVTWGKNMGSIAGNPQYDAARANWGSSWRLPTKDEIDELISNKCKWEWTTLNGHRGYKVTGPNGNSIFLPAAGYRYGASRDYDGEYGNYWSATPYEVNTSNAYDLDFYSDDFYRYWYYRYYGQSVRSVSE